MEFDIFSPQLKEHRFPDTALGMKQAKLLQMKMNRDYGYKPEILRVHKKSTGENFLVIVKPRGLGKIR